RGAAGLPRRAAPRRHPRPGPQAQGLGDRRGVRAVATIGANATRLAASLGERIEERSPRLAAKRPTGTLPGGGVLMSGRRTYWRGRGAPGAPLGEPSGQLALRDPDVRLMLRVRDDEPGAFEELVENYQHRLIGVMHHLVGNAEEAEDLAQEVFLR